MQRVTELNSSSSSNEEGVEENGGKQKVNYLSLVIIFSSVINILGVMVSFVNGQIIKEKVGPIKSGPLFDYLLDLSSGNKAVDIEKGK